MFDHLRRESLRCSRGTMLLLGKIWGNLSTKDSSSPGVGHTSRRGGGDSDCSARCGVLTTGRVRERTSASSWRSARTQRRRRTWPDAHGDVVGAPCLPRALHSLERMSTPPCQERVVRPCKDTQYHSAGWPWRHHASGRRDRVSWLAKELHHGNGIRRGQPHRHFDEGHGPIHSLLPRGV